MSFHHQPLDLSQQQIRLINFTPLSFQAQPDEPNISLTITHHNFSEAPRYTALSYTWGPEHPRTIVVDGRPFVIRENLWQFLEIAASRYRQTTFWIDQICIDQQDEKEKGHQVQFMGDIFYHAERVIAWLGPASADSECLARLPSMKWADTQAKGRMAYDLSGVFSRRYWSRLWIIQEIALARKLLLLCGTTEFRWEDLGPVMMDHDRYPIPNSLRTLYHLKDRFRDKSLSLGSIVYFFHTLDDWYCENSLDLVYGLLGLVQKEQKLVVDYSKTKSMVVREVFDVVMDSCEVETFEVTAKSQTKSEYLDSVQLKIGATWNTLIAVCRVFKLELSDDELCFRKAWEDKLQCIPDAYRQAVMEDSHFWERCEA